MSRKVHNRIASAFSLIELSIVLVIIGLIIAGIIGGSNLIRGATLRAAMAEYRVYRSACNSFMSNYNYLPGDYVSAIGTSGATNGQGNGDGQIQYVNGAATNVAEGLVAFQHLQNAGMLDITFTPSTASVTIASATLPAPIIGQGINSTIPWSKVKNGSWVFDTITSAANANVGGNSFVILTGAPAQVTGIAGGTAVALTTVPILSANDALAMDNKLDDGKADMGTVVATGLAGLTSCSGASSAGVSGYTTGTTANVCALALQVSN